MLTMKELPEAQRPIEKLIAGGSEALRDDELLAILLGSGSARQNAIALGRTLLERYPDPDALFGATVQELILTPGIGNTKASRIVAGLQLGRRLAERRDYTRITVRDPDSVAAYLYHLYGAEQREHFYVLLLDTKNRPISTELVSIGTLNSTLVHPREVFRPAIRHAARSILLSHNHPSGDPQPSEEDIQLTRRLTEAGKLLGIPVLDHVIIGRNRFLSMKRENYF